MGFRETLFDVDSARKKFLEVLGENISSREYWHVVPTWSCLTPAVQALHEVHPLWQFNVGDDGRSWVAEDGVFLAWPNAWKDIQLLLGADHPARDSEFKLLARQLLIEGAILSASDNRPDPLWLIQPSNCLYLKSRQGFCNHSYMIKISTPEQIFDQIPEPIPVEIKRPRW